MRSNPYQAYIHDEILTADPVRLVQLLYRGAIEATGDARRRLKEGDIKGRSAAITKAVEILAELASSLDHSKGGKLSAQLAELYDYMQRRLLAANSEQSEAPLAEVEELMETLEGAWQQCTPVERHTSPADSGLSIDHFSTPEYVPLSCAC
jgi:flagellar protein FliS